MNWMRFCINNWSSLKNKKQPDVDIDVADRAKALEGLDFTPASQLVEGRLKKHNSGVFFQNVPVDPVTKLCALPSGAAAGELAGNAGFQKVDFLPNTAYHGVRDPEHLQELMARPVPWELFETETIVKQLSHIGKHHELVYAYQPRSIEDLACIIALIRPGMIHLKGKSMAVVRREVWKKAEGYTFKKSHAIAFAMMIVVQLQALLESGNVWTFDEAGDVRDSPAGGGPDKGDRTAGSDG